MSYSADEDFYARPSFYDRDDELAYEYERNPRKIRTSFDEEEEVVLEKPDNSLKKGELVDLSGEKHIPGWIKMFFMLALIGAVLTCIVFVYIQLYGRNGEMSPNMFVKFIKKKVNEIPE
jgi:hypothetical protein